MTFLLESLLSGEIPTSDHFHLEISTSEHFSLEITPLL